LVTVPKRIAGGVDDGGILLYGRDSRHPTWPIGSDVLIGNLGDSFERVMLLTDMRVGLEFRL
jgi:hypothetical protein